MSVKFNVGDKVRVIDVKAIDRGRDHYYNGMETEVVSLFYTYGPRLRNKDGEEGIVITEDELHAIEKIEDTPPKPTKNQRIKALETKLEALEERMAMYEEVLTEGKAEEGPKFTVTLDGKDFGEIKPGIVATVNVSNLQTPNARRKAVIDEARKFINERVAVGTGKYPPYDSYEGEGNATHRSRYYEVAFHVNKEKRAVTALVKQSDRLGYVYGVIEKGTAKCAPSDVFNEDIGKAIALGRALGLDVTRFEQAIQPSEVVVGHKVELVTDSGKYFGIDTVGEVHGYSSRWNAVLVSRFGRGLVNGRGRNSAFYEGSRILEDTDAEYAE